MSININPTYWGPPAWKFLHYITLSYPDNPVDSDKVRVYNFFMNIKDVLPCEKCRFNFNDHLVKYPLDNNVLSSRYNLANWLLNIHNEVNISLGKPIFTYNQLLEMLSSNGINANSNSDSNDSNDSNNSNSYSFWLNMSTQTMTIIFIIILILILLLAIKLKNY